MTKYNHQKVEKKWQQVWKDKKVFTANDFSKKPKKYILVEFPYPSGAGLHMGHLRPYVAADVYSRFNRLNGKETLFPMGWDAFGLPAENYAIKMGVHPSKTTAQNIKNAKKQLQSWGLSFDWDREINTTDPDYFKWTQWLFLQFYKKGLAYESTGLINWCPKDKTGLANEEVIDGKCERCGTVVEKKELRQWYLKITAYAEKLLAGLKDLKEWPEAVKLQQENWIGKSVGAEIEFSISDELPSSAKASAGRQVTSDRKPNFLLLHGKGGSPKTDFFPWLKKQLEEKGFSVQVPGLPNSKMPNDNEQTDYVQKNCAVDSSTVIVGHSFGGIVALRLLERGCSPHRVVLAGTPFSGDFLDGKRRPSVDDALKKGFNFKSILLNCKNFTALFDLHDQIVPVSDGQQFASNLKIPLTLVTAAEPHFNGGIEPTVLEQLSPKVKVFTTRPDTIFGATYLVLAPEHSVIENLKSQIENYAEVKKYIEEAKSKSDIDRSAEGKQKTGVVLKGVTVTNPATKEKIPVWVADYVLGHYGTGAIMAVPAHDERDFEFAKKFGLPIKQVVRSDDQNVIIVHGCPGSQRDQRPFEENWRLWLSKELNKKGVSAVSPEMPTPWQPKYSEWKKELGKYPITDKTILVGHSCSAAFLVRWIGETKTKVHKLILVAPALIPKAKDVRLRDLYEFKFDSNIQDYIGESIILLSNDKQRHLDSAEIYRKALGARVINFENKGHFTFDEMRTNKFPELLDEIVGAGLGRPNSPDGARALYQNQMIGTRRASAAPTTARGTLVDSGEFTGIQSEDAIPKMAAAYGELTTQYKLRDWVFSRQRYWGEPIPIIHCQEHGAVPVPEKDLPVKLPNVKKYEPTGTGESPLAGIASWVKTKCPLCKKVARRETNTMPQWAGSSWYWLRYTDPKNKKAFADKKKQKYWTPVDVYFGGMEHTTLHLLYSRFWNLFLHDQKLVSAKEPYTKRVPHGIILGPDGEKMSKSRGNVVNPDDIVKTYGADTLRMYELFLGPHEAMVAWNDKGVVGVRRFLDRVWQWVQEVESHQVIKSSSRKSSSHQVIKSKVIKSSSHQVENEKSERALNRLIKKVGDDIESFHFNTSVSSFMEFLNSVQHEKVGVGAEYVKKFLVLLYPFAPHISEELYKVIGGKKSLQLEAWPEFDETKIVESTVEIVVQVNGKVKGKVSVPSGSPEDAVKIQASKLPQVSAITSAGTVKRVIFIPNRLINLVV